MTPRQSIAFGILLGKGYAAKVAYAIVHKPRRRKRNRNQLELGV